MELEDKLKKLEEIIEGYGQMIVALSGGVDSTFLLAFASEVFRRDGCPDNVAAITAIGPQFAADESGYAEELCDSLSIAHKKIDVSYVLDLIKDNPPDRCYHCKRELFGALKERADMVGSVLADGTNLDDLDDYRPGYRAIQELGVASPLKEAGLTKADVREALARLDIKTAADKAYTPAFACLITRIPYGEEVTEEKLRMIYAAEDYIKSLGFSQIRVRCHESAGGQGQYLARIELEEADLYRMFEINSEGGDPAKACERELKEIGFKYVALDLGGYAKGKMNQNMPTK